MVLNHTHCLTVPNHAVIGVICDVHFPGWFTNVWMGYCVEVDMYMVPELTSWSEKPVGA